jgi:hypothetical protein
MGRAERMFNHYEQEHAATVQSTEQTAGVTDQSLQQFETRLTHNMSAQLAEITAKMESMIDTKLQNAMRNLSTIHR